VHFFAKLSLKLLKGRIEVKNRPQKSGYLVVGNHLGFIDILMIASEIPSVFVTSQEMRETPLLGLLTEMGGCIYVERRERSNILNERSMITNTLHEGFDVVLYAEGTSGNGEKVLPFKRTLMMAVAGTDYNILPVCTNFVKCDDEPFSHKWRDHLCWYGDIPFATSLFKTLSLNSFDASMEFLDEVKVENESQRKEIASKVQALIEEKYIPIPIPAPSEAQA
jgi:1-acyl-sn-glycerol-3-phosphate acyltransferase